LDGRITFNERYTAMNTSNLKALEDKLITTSVKLQELINKYPYNSLVHQVLVQFKKDMDGIGNNNE
jgi:hypothetical protein